MIRPLFRRLLPPMAALALAACASAPTHYYTLVSPADAAGPAAAAPGGVPFELLPVSVPAQDDQPQLVVRQGGQGVALLDTERWIAPLGEEIRAALSAQLAARLGQPDVSGLAHAGGEPVARIKVDVRRFDSQPGGYALLEAAWSLRLTGESATSASLACTSQWRQPVGPGYDALVGGHQQALARLAGQIADAVRALPGGQARCPGG